MESAELGQVSTAAAEVYETFFVPALFGQFATRVAEAAGIRPGDTVLDVACGTGALTREARRRAGAAGTVTGLDRNAGMLAVARRSDPAIDWREGMAEALPFADGHFDAVVSQFGLMFFEDRSRALREMWRVLKPGGRLVVAVWDSAERSPGYRQMIGLLDRLFGPDIAAGLEAPFVLGDPADFAAAFTAAGLPDVRIETLPGTARFPSIDDWVRTDVKGWTLADAIDEDGYRRLKRAAREELRAFAGPDGAVAFAAPAHLGIARK